MWDRFLSLKEIIFHVLNVIENLPNQVPIRLMNQNLLFSSENQFILLSNFHRLVI